MTDALARARADLDAGQAWKARDRLTGVMSSRTDDEVLDLMGETYFAMGDLPAAGAVWFVTGRDDAPARAASAAWHERHGSAEARLQSIPRARRTSPVEPHIQELQRAARLAAQARGDSPQRTYLIGDDAHGADWEGIVIATVTLILLALIAIGGVTVLRWIVP